MIRLGKIRPIRSGLVRWFRWVHNDCFPNVKELAKRFGVDKDVFHDEIKPQIKNDFKAEMKSINSKNPDIGISDSGTILLKNPSTGTVVDTGVPASSYGPY